MPDRFCVTGCGNKLGPMQLSNSKCRGCKEKDTHEKRRQAGQRILDENKAAGRVRLHSCVAHLLDPMPKSCQCRKFVTFTEAREFIRIGRAVDFRTREACFHERAIVEASKQKNPPVSTLGSRIAIERIVVNDGGNRFDEKEIAKMKASIAEDSSWRKAERDSKVDFEHQLALEHQALLVRVHSDEEWLEIEQVQRTLPGYVCGVGQDERTSIGRTVRGCSETSEGVDTEQESVGDGFGIVDTEQPEGDEREEELEVGEETDIEDMAEAA